MKKGTMPRFTLIVDSPGGKTILIVCRIICVVLLCIATGSSVWADDSQHEAQWSVQRAKLAADVATRRPLQRIIREAVNAGIDIEKVVTTLIEAGADSQAVVYTAILEGHSGSQVVKAALKAHADLQRVVSAAIAAGADSALICKFAAEAGVTTEACADAAASASAAGAPVYGYSSPTSESGIYSPGTTIVYGGGGGSTKKASPHKP